MSSPSIPIRRSLVNHTGLPVRTAFLQKFDPGSQGRIDDVLAVDELLLCLVLVLKPLNFGGQGLDQLSLLDHSLFADVTSYQRYERGQPRTAEEEVQDHLKSVHFTTLI